MDQIVKQLEQSLRVVVSKCHEALGQIRTGRASSLLVENIVVEAYGQTLPVKQLGTISVGAAREMTISLWDQTVVQAVGKAIENSNLGVNPTIDGNLIRINFPPLTQERRTELGRLASKTAEEFKIEIRHHRDEANKKANALNIEDEKFKAKEKIQGVVDKANKEIEETLKGKVDEINA